MTQPLLVAAEYDQRAHTFGRSFRACDYRFQGSFLQRQHVFLSRLNSLRGKRILDIGCGNGLMTASLSRDRFLVGLDLSFEMLNLATKSLRPIQGEGEYLPFQTESFDVVLASEILQHLADPTLLLKEISRVTEKEGILLISSLNRASLMHWLYSPWGSYQGLYFHSLEKICQILKNEGFLLLEISFLGFPFPWVWRNRVPKRLLPSFWASSWVIKGRKAGS